MYVFCSELCQLADDHVSPASEGPGVGAAGGRSAMGSEYHFVFARRRGEEEAKRRSWHVLPVCVCGCDSCLLGFCDFTAVGVVVFLWQINLFRFFGPFFFFESNFVSCVFVSFVLFFAFFFFVLVISG